MIGIERGLRHLSWADDQLFEYMADMPSKALQATYAPDTWPVGRLLTHIVDGAQWYRFCLTGEPWVELLSPRDDMDITELRTYLRSVNASLLAQAELPDERVTFDDDGTQRSAWRSTILTQAIVHAAEHRTQIACALAAHGLQPPVLDDLDLWAFETAESASN